MVQIEKINRLVARIGDEFYFCEKFFDYGKEFEGLCGFTGLVVRPVSHDEIEERLSPDCLADSYEEVWRQAVQSGDTIEGLNDWLEDFALEVENVIDIAPPNVEDAMRPLFPDSERWEYFEITRPGRIFMSRMTFDEVFDQTLLNRIRAIEDRDLTRR